MAIPNEFNISTRIVYGRDSAAQIGEIAAGLNLKKIQLVTDKGVANSGTLDYLSIPLKLPVLIQLSLMMSSIIRLFKRLTRPSNSSGMKTAME